MVPPHMDRVRTGLIPRSTFYGFTRMYDSNDGPDGTWSAEADSAQYLRELVGHRHVLETLDALSNRPTTTAQMRRHVGVSRRGLAAVLRTLAAHGLARTSRAGSWDGPAPRDTLYCLTDRGRAVVATLSRLSVWTVLLEGPDLDGRPDRQPDERP
jgi:DNA-binding HxlR family transcriptional regulator